MIIPFKIKVDRIQDCIMEDGSTVGTLRNKLVAAGMDVARAYARLNRASDGMQVHGSIDGYELHDGDTVEFRTESFALPNADEALKRVKAAKKCAQEECKCDNAKDGIKVFVVVLD